MLSLEDVKQIARDAAYQTHAALEIIGAVRSEGESSCYMELMIARRGTEPGPMVVGIDRDQSQSQCRATLLIRFGEDAPKARAAGRA